jgi:hypothetical protein
MKIFISQPMQNKTDAEILAERERAIKAAKTKWGAGVEVLESFFQDAPVGAKPLWFLGESLKVMADADAVILCPNWCLTRGCIVEAAAANRYNIPTFVMVDGVLR